MERSARLRIAAIAAAFLLIGTIAVAQSAHKSRAVKPREASSGQASGIHQRKDGAIVAGDYSRAKMGNAGVIDRASNSTAHADTPSPKSGKSENPMYEHSGNSGTNPMYEPKSELKTSGKDSDSAPAQQETSKKHIAGVKYQDRAAGKQSDKGSSAEKFKQDFGPVQANKK